MHHLLRSVRIAHFQVDRGCGREKLRLEAGLKVTNGLAHFGLRLRFVVVRS
jgi:hypothetical protein